MGHVEQKLETIVNKLHEMNLILAKNTESLITHEKRTDIAERKMEVLNARIDEIKDKEKEQFVELQDEVHTQMEKLNEQMLPIKIHVESVEKVISVIFKIVIPCFVGILALMYKLGWIHIGK